RSTTVQTISETALSILAVVSLHNPLGYAVRFRIGRGLNFSLQDQRAISTDVGTQSSRLAATLATAHFSPIAAVPGARFSVWHNISGSLVANWMSKMENDEDDNAEVEESGKTEEIIT